MRGASCPTSEPGDEMFQVRYFECLDVFQDRGAGERAHVQDQGAGGGPGVAEEPGQRERGHHGSGRQQRV